MKPVFSEDDYNRGTNDFDPNEVRHRAEAIISATNEHLKEFNKHEPTARGFLAAGKINETEGDLAYAIRWYERAIGADPELHEARARLALAQIKSSQHESRAHVRQQALENALKLVQSAPKLVFAAVVRRRPLSAWTVLGDAQRAHGNDNAAIEAYSKAIVVEPRDMYAAGHLGTLLLKQGNVDEALKQLNNVDRQNGVFGQIEAAVRLAAANPETLISIRNIVTVLSVAEPAA
ncbi:tetratricopeptide repeat protein [Photobacterium sp. 53610]|uniref:tetratricopeptide repeat protein n=1 Tax=Photobacterium sp. 53610 TaxID=3102789 RepID=UPI002ED95E7A